MKVELFYTPGCSACSSAHEKLCEAARQVVHDVEWYELNIVENVDRAVELGVLTVPSIVIDGALVFTSMPTVTQLRRELTRRLGKGV
jgi:thioredoxin 1